jgi:hypothetical protein
MCARKELVDINIFEVFLDSYKKVRTISGSFDMAELYFKACKN